MAKLSLYWLQAGGCGGDTMSLLCAESPDLVELLDLLELEVLWHPSLSHICGFRHQQLIETLVDGRRRLDILVVEGTVIRGPGGTGMYSTFAGRPTKDLIADLAGQAQVVVAMGTCASFGGIGANGEVEATGLQFHKEQPGGFLGAGFRARGGLPVVNLPGCPCHPAVAVGALSALVYGEPLPLRENNTPEQYYGLLVHQGCVRNEYHEYRIEERDFGEKGCLFFHMGCRAPLTHGPCNKLLWNRRSSKTGAGVPCVGCTQPDFPRPEPFFRSRSIADVPLDLPEGVDRAHYLAYKGMAAAAAPERLRTRKTRV